MRKYLVASPSPNHRIASGIQAMGGMGRTISMMGLKMASTRGYQPMVTFSFFHLYYPFLSEFGLQRGIFFVIYRRK